MNPRRALKPLAVVSCALALAACGRADPENDRASGAAAAVKAPAATTAPTTVEDATTVATGSLEALPLLLPGHLPPSVTIVQASANEAASDAWGAPAEWRIQAGDGVRTVEILVAAGTAATVADAASAATTGPEVTVEATIVQGTPATLVRYAGSDSATLIWYGFGAEIQLSGDVGAEEILKIADGLRVVDAPTWHATVDPVFDIGVHTEGTWDGVAWTLDASYDPQGWCAEVVNGLGDPSVCEPVASPRDADAVVMALEDTPVIVGLTRVSGAVRAEVRTATGAVLATADVVAADPAPFRAFAMWPPLTAADPATEVVFLDGTGTPVARVPYVAG